MIDGRRIDRALNDDPDGCSRGETRFIPGVLTELPPASPRRGRDYRLSGGMFTFVWKKFSGSYFAFSARSRW